MKLVWVLTYYSDSNGHTLCGVFTSKAKVRKYLKPELEGEHVAWTERPDFLQARFIGVEYDASYQAHRMEVG